MIVDALFNFLSKKIQLLSAKTLLNFELFLTVSRGFENLVHMLQLLNSFFGRNV